MRGAISAFTVHNTSYGPLAPEFYKCYWHVKKRWKEFLPIQTTCIKITYWNGDFIFRRLKHACFSLIGRNVKPLPRLEDPRSVLLSDAQPDHKHNARDGATALIGSK